MVDIFKEIMFSIFGLVKSNFCFFFKSVSHLKSKSKVDWKFTYV